MMMVETENHLNSSRSQTNLNDTHLTKEEVDTFFSGIRAYHQDDNNGRVIL